MVKERNRQVLDMTQGRPSTLLPGFSLPFVLGSLFQQLYTFVDTLIVGRQFVWHFMFQMWQLAWLPLVLYGKACYGLYRFRGQDIFHGRPACPGI